MFLLTQTSKVLRKELIITDTDGDIITFQLSGNKLKQLVNDKVEIEEVSPV